MTDPANENQVKSEAAGNSDHWGKARQAAAVLSEFFRGEAPETAVILGSGLGQIADGLRGARILPNSEMPGLAASSVAGHEGRFLLGELKGKRILFLQGRLHYYEGHPMDEVVLTVRAMGLAGVKQLILTNAAGAVTPGWRAGTIMLIKDHVSLFCPSPLRGPNDDSAGPRFPDMTRVYDSGLLDAAREAAAAAKVKVREGVYCFFPGPQYETPAEIDFLGRLGANAVGMSTVPEAIAARHLGMSVMGLSALTNMAAGYSDRELSHEEVLKAGKKMGLDMLKLLVGIIERI